MRVATAVVGAVLLLGLVAVALLAFAGGATPGGPLAVADSALSDGPLTERWTSDTGRSGTVNHHAPAGGLAGERGMVYAPISDESNSEACGLLALEAGDGTERWRHAVPPERCTVHAVADPTVADFDGDGVAEVFVTTTEEAVLGLHPLTGEEEFRYELTAYGYSRPLVTDLTGDGAPEVVVVDVQGTVSVLDANGTLQWERQLSAYTWGQPSVADFDGDGEPELFVGAGESGRLVAYEGDGSVAWERDAPLDGAVTWLSAGQADDDAPVEVAVATTEGVVGVVDGRDGAVQWRRDLGTLAAVHALGDGDGDGEAELYAVAADGALRSFTASDGTDEWTTSLAAEPAQMTPPPSLGDLNGDGAFELVAVTNGGAVSVVDPTTGEVLDTYRRDVPIWTHPTLADVTGDGVPEVFVIYGDGRVVALSFSG